MLVEALIAVCLVGSAVVTFVPDRHAEKLALGISALPVGEIGRASCRERV